MPQPMREQRVMRAVVAADTRRSCRKAFTLVELLVVVVIVMALAALMLAGMAGARKRAKIDRTKNTIRKIHEIVMPQYESYAGRRVPFAVTPSAVTNAFNRLVATRQLLVYEMPDSWNDVCSNVVVVTTSLPAFSRTGPVLNYAATRAELGVNVAATNGGAECLYMIASRGIGEPDAMERFRTDEVGDTDGDGAPEFLDAWGRPIGFIRWAPGFSPLSPVQKPDPIDYHDPLDPLGVDVSGYALIPLIVSAGPDGLPGIQGSGGWQPADSTVLASLVAGPGATYGAPDTSNARADNITNHDLVTK